MTAHDQHDAVDLIRAKRDGGTLTGEQISWLIRAYTDGAVADEQMSALAMAVLLRGMSRAEISQWTGAMIASGERMDFSGLRAADGTRRLTADKHSTGGVGTRSPCPWRRWSPASAFLSRSSPGAGSATPEALWTSWSPFPGGGPT